MIKGVLTRALSVFIVAAFAVLLVGMGSFGGLLQHQEDNVAAAPLADPTWITGVQVQNLDQSNTANIVIKYYNRSDGSLAATQSDSIAPGSSKTYFANTMAVGSGFAGSAVVESDRQIAAIVNEIADPPLMTASYDGVTATSTTVYLPLIMRNNNGWNTTIFVQNAGTSDASNVRLSFKGPSNYDMPGFSVKAGQSVSIPQSTMTQLTSSNGRWVGSVTITSDQPVAASVNQTDGTQLLAYSGFTSGGSKVYAPLLMNNNNGWFTGFQVMNIGSSPATVNLKVDGTTVDTVGIQPGASQTWFPIPGMTSKVAAGTAEGATGSEQLVGIINEVVSNGQGASYNAFNSGTAKIFAPLLMTNNNGLYTGFQVMNIGSSTAGVQLYVDGALKDQVNIDPGKSKTWFPIPNQTSKVGSGYAVGVSGTEQLVGIVNEIKDAAGDNAMSYEGINQ